MEMQVYEMMQWDPCSSSMRRLTNRRRKDRGEKVDGWANSRKRAFGDELHRYLVTYLHVSHVYRYLVTSLHGYMHDIKKKLALASLGMPTSLTPHCLSQFVLPTFSLPFLLPTTKPLLEDRATWLLRLCMPLNLLLSLTSCSTEKCLRILVVSVHACRIMYELFRCSLFVSLDFHVSARSARVQLNVYAHSICTLSAKYIISSAWFPPSPPSVAM